MADEARVAVRRTRVGIIFGGISCEREVSFLSARSVISALDTERFDVIPIEIRADRRWVISPSILPPGKLSLKRAGQTEPDVLGSLAKQFMPELATTEDSLVPEPLATAVDVIFPLLHGPYGEDGTVQGLLELAQVPYVGSGVLGSALNMDKALMKVVLERHGIPVSRHLVILRSRWRSSSEEVFKECEDSLALPWFVKPASLGSSIGISKVHTAEEFREAMNRAQSYDRKLIVEEAVEDAREVEVSVLGNDEPEVSVPGEIFSPNAFYDYDAKYFNPATKLAIPADLPDEVVNTIRRLAIQAFRALDCAGMARIDFLVRRRDFRVYLLEVNTIPGFTPTSMYPMLWEASGLPFNELVGRLIKLAVERFEDRRTNAVAE